MNWSVRVVNARNPQWKQVSVPCCWSVPNPSCARCALPVAPASNKFAGQMCSMGSVTMALLALFCMLQLQGIRHSRLCLANPCETNRRLFTSVQRQSRRICDQGAPGAPSHAAPPLQLIASSQQPCAPKHQHEACLGRSGKRCLAPAAHRRGRQHCGTLQGSTGHAGGGGGGEPCVVNELESREQHRLEGPTRLHAQHVCPPRRSRPVPERRLATATSSSSPPSKLR